MNQFFQINDTNVLDELIEKSYQESVLLFKHSSTCPVSAFAFLQLTSFLEEYSGRLECAMVVVQQAREVSNEIARRLRVEHQSPQAILLYEGAAIWNDSHNRLTEKNFQEAVRENIKSAPQI